MISLHSQEIDLKGLFKPTKYDKYTFIKNEILTEEEITSDSLFLPDFSRVVSPNFVFQVTENRMLLTILETETTGISNILIKILEIEKIEILSSSINLDYLFYLSTDEETSTLSKSFRNKDNKIQQQHFTSDDSQFGFYASKNFLNTRLKLDVHPSALVEESEKKKIIIFDFKFQNEFNILEEENQLKFIDVVKNFESLKKECTKIIDELKG